MSDITPSQTVGPFFAYGLAPHNRCEWRPERARHLRLEGYRRRQSDHAGRLRQQDPHRRPRARRRRPADQRRHDRNLAGRCPRPLRLAARRRVRGRTPSSRASAARPPTRTASILFDTIKPGPVPGPNGKNQAPHIVVCIFSRGMLRQIYTRLYFSDEAANAADPILNMVPADRRGTLIAHKQDGGEQARLPLRHSRPGRQRDCFLRHLSTLGRAFAPTLAHYAA